MSASLTLNLTSQRLWLILGLLLLALAGVTVYKAWPVLFPPLQQKLPVAAECDLRAGPCSRGLPGGGKLSFGITPSKIPMLTPLELRVEISGPQPDRVEVDFSGVDMYMGFNRVTLQPQGQGTFSGKGRLPVCVYDAMEWEAQVLLHSGRDIVSVPHRFITVKADR